MSNKENQLIWNGYFIGFMSLSVYRYWKEMVLFCEGRETYSHSRESHFYTTRYDHVRNWIECFCCLCCLIFVLVFVPLNASTVFRLLWCMCRSRIT